MQSLNCPDPTLEQTEVERVRMDPLAVGCLETTSIARGIEAADAMLKAAQVRLLAASPVCPGKYVILVGGGVAEVQAAVQAGEETASDTLCDAIVIPNVHPQVLDAFTAATAPEHIAAIGVIETFSFAVGGAGRRPGGQERGGPAPGDPHGARWAARRTDPPARSPRKQAALEAGAKAGGQNGLMLARTRIPAPHPDLIEKLL